jgi:hypothetical protein
VEQAAAAPASQKFPSMKAYVDHCLEIGKRIHANDRVLLEKRTGGWAAIDYLINNRSDSAEEANSRMLEESGDISILERHVANSRGKKALAVNFGTRIKNGFFTNADNAIFLPKGYRIICLAHNSDESGQLMIALSPDDYEDWLNSPNKSGIAKIFARKTGMIEFLCRYSTQKYNHTTSPTWCDLRSYRSKKIEKCKF